MSELPPPTMQDPGSLANRKKSSLVIWGRRYAAVCDVLASIFLLSAAALFLLLLALGINRQTEWRGVPLVVALFIFALGTGFTALLLARLSSLSLGWLGAIIGLVFTNSALILALIGSKVGFTLDNTLLGGFCKTAHPLGIYLIAASVIHLVIANLYFITHSRQLVAEKFRQDDVEGGSHKQSISFMPKCWEMYSCPDAARERCPNYLDKVCCWKRRRGCLCDHKLSTYLFHGVAAREALRQANPARVDLAQLSDLESYPARLREARPRSWRERRPFCHNCALFMEHQGYKYRRLNWIFLPISAVLLVVLFPYYHLGYNLGAHLLDNLSRKVMTSGHLPAGFYSDASTLVGSSYEYLLLLVLSLLLMSYVVEFTDWCLLEWKV